MLRIASFHFTQRYLSLCEMRLALLVLLFCIIIASYRSYPKEFIDFLLRAGRAGEYSSQPVGSG
jgi:hypothetical protein